MGGTSRHGHGLELPRLLRAVANTGRENDARDCQMTRPPTKAASDASYQTYRDARAIRITTTTANKVICAHRLLAKLWLLLSLCIAMVMTSFQDTILNGGIQKRAPVNGKGH
jgi:hypothetical protein